MVSTVLKLHDLRGSKIYQWMFWCIFIKIYKIQRIDNHSGIFFYTCDSGELCLHHDRIVPFIQLTKLYISNIVFSLYVQSCKKYNNLNNMIILIYICVNMIYWENLIWLLNFSEIGLEKIKIKIIFLSWKNLNIKILAHIHFKYVKPYFHWKIYSYLVCTKNDKYYKKWNCFWPF
jgi:hypothetical protein